MDKPAILYTALRPLDQSATDPGLSWSSYIEWSNLIQLTELVSLDRMLNEPLVVPDYDNAEDWHFIHIDGLYQTGFYTTAAYVLQKSQPHGRFNFLAVIINPGQDCKDLLIDGYEFMGYELLDKEYGNSALTNCKGFEKALLPKELTGQGLLAEFSRARDIQRMLKESYPDERHAHTNLIAVWRHKTIGRL